MGAARKQEQVVRRRLGISELEERLHASRSTISRWVKAGRLAPPHFLGGRRLWFEDQVAKFERGASSSPAGAES